MNTAALQQMMTKSGMGSSWPEIAMNWLVHQGVSTILLFFMVYGIYVQVPSSLKIIQQGYDRNAESLSADVTRMEKVVERLLSWVETSARLTQENQRILRENERQIEENTRRLTTLLEARSSQGGAHESRSSTNDP